MIKVFIDTDVILDHLIDRKPYVIHSSQILNECEKGIIKGYTTPVIISNLYYLLRKFNSHSKVIKVILNLTTIIDILPVTIEDIQSALRSPFKDFEDAIQYQSALNSGIIQCIITRNTKDFKSSQIPVMTPEIFIKTYPLL